MKLAFTRLAGLLGCLLGVGQLASAQTIYSPAPLNVSTSFTADVIANGSGSAISSTSTTFDRGIVNIRYCLANTTFINAAGQSPTATQALPASGLITSATTAGLTFQLAPANGNNSLRLDLGASGTLTLLTPKSCTEVMLIAAQGNGDSVGKTFVVTFTDGTTQTFTSVLVPDWFGGANPAIILGSRINRDTDAITPETNNPRLYEVRLTLAAANTAKLVASITVTNVVNANSSCILNVMGVSLGAVCQGAPVAGTAVATPTSVCPGQSSVLTVTGATSNSNISYQWQQSTNGGTTFTNIAGATSSTYTATPTATTQYRVVVTCSNQSTNSTATTVTVLPTTSAVSYAATGGAAAFCTTSGPQVVVSAIPAGGSYSANAPGLSINASTGTITPATSAPGIYTVTYLPPAGSCAAAATTLVVIDAPPTVTLTYPAASYCPAAGTAAPTAATPTGGTFAGSTGLVVNALTGVVDLALTPAGTYTVGYTSYGTCAATATTTLTVLPAQPATLSFAAASYCRNGAAPVPTANPAGGTFSGSAGLVIDASTGAINLAGTPAGTYSVTYSGPGPCAQPATASVTLLAAPTVSVSYGTAPFCQAGTNPAPTAFSPAGGTFSGSTGLVINASTGVLNLTSTPAGTYAVRYTSAGPCATTATATVTIVPVQAVTLRFNGTTFCKAGTAPVATATPAGGTFQASGGLFIDASTGAIDLANTPNGSYSVTYTSAGFCAGQATALLTIQGNPAPLYPTVLTPNGDGLNDVLTFKLADVQNYSLRVFSRWGRQVYEGHRATEGWSPTDNTAGTYYYLVEYTDCAGHPLTAQNWVEVIK